MDYDSQVCESCGSSSVFKIPSLSNFKSSPSTTQPGKVVDEYIRDTKKEIREDKKNLKGRDL